MSSGASSGFTKQMARNIFYGGSLFFIFIFVFLLQIGGKQFIAFVRHHGQYVHLFIFIFIGLVFDSERRIPERSNQSQMSEAVVRGKKIWETRNCVGCHSLLGEGAYFAPELGNVYKRRGGDDGGAEFIKGWMQAQPLGAKGRRQMPQFNLTDEQLDDLVEFLKWTGEIDTESWPPNIEG